MENIDAFFQMDIQELTQSIKELTREIRELKEKLNVGNFLPSQSEVSFH